MPKKKNVKTLQKLKEEAFKADLLKEYSITKKDNINNKTEDDVIKEMAKKSKTNISEDTWK